MRNYLFVAMLILLTGMFFACGGNATEQEQTQAEDQTEATTDEQVQDEAKSEALVHGQGAEYTSPYVCPMHCKGSGSEEAGKCPACGMDYVALADHSTDGHSHMMSKEGGQQ